MQSWTLGRLYIAKFKPLRMGGNPFGLKTKVVPRCKHSRTPLYRPISKCSKGHSRCCLIRSIPKYSNVCMNVTSWRVRGTIFDVEEQEASFIFRVWVCSLSYPAYKAHAPHYNAIYGLPGYTIFFYIISQTAWFPKKKEMFLNAKCLFWFSL